MAESQIVFYRTSSSLQQETLLWAKTGGKNSELYDKTLILPPEAARRRTFKK